MSYRVGDLRKPNDFRSIEGLSEVRANGRVLNMAAIHRDLGGTVRDAGGERAGMFASATLNQAIIVKHNIRENERCLFPRARPVATKLILPIDPDDLSIGGVAFMLGERQASRILKEKLGLTRTSEDARAQRDLRMLDVLDSLATLDPFIVRERLAVDGVELPESFATFQIAGDHALHEYMKAQLAPLVRLAVNGGKRGPDTAANARSIERLVDEIFSGAQDGKAVLLREALQIAPPQWPGALYTWKAALFYEYRVRNFEPRFRRFMESLQGAKLYGFSVQAPAEIVLRLRYDLLDRGVRTKAHLDRLLASFNQAYRKDLIGEGTPDAFRSYLLSLQDKLYDFGVVYGVLEQMVGYWEYWFLSRGMSAIPADFFMGIARDLLSSADPSKFGPMPSAPPVPQARGSAAAGTEGADKTVLI